MDLTFTVITASPMPKLFCYCVAIQAVLFYQHYNCDGVTSLENIDTEAKLPDAQQLLGSMTQFLTRKKRNKTKAKGNQDRSLGMRGKTNKKINRRNRTAYPWQVTKAGRVRPVYTETMLRYRREDEEPFAEDYYDDYDFEFAKSGIKNDNFERKYLKYQWRRWNEAERMKQAKKEGMCCS